MVHVSKHDVLLSSMAVIFAVSANLDMTGVYDALMCFQGLSDPRFFFILISFKLNLEERHLACGLNAQRVTKTYFWEAPLFVNEAQIPCTKE